MRIAVVLACLVATAHADDVIEQAKQLEAKLAHDEALAIIETAIASGKSDRDRLVILHLTAGRLNAGLDRAQAAEDHFAIVLALAPATTLPDDVSPKIAVPFTRARTKSKPLDVKLVVTKDDIAVEANDPIVAGIALVLADGTTHVERGLRTPRKPNVTAVRALDRHGNVVWTGAPPPEPVIDRPKPVVVDEPGLFARWTTWAALTGVALTSGGIAAWRFDSAQNEFDRKRDAGMTDFTELRAIEDRGKRWALAANISFGVAAATAITGIVFFVRRDSGVAVTPTANGVGVAGRF